MSYDRIGIEPSLAALRSLSAVLVVAPVWTSPADPRTDAERTCGWNAKDHGCQQHGGKRSTVNAATIPATGAAVGVMARHIAELNHRAAEADMRLKRLYDAIEAGSLDPAETSLGERIAGLTALRDQARADATRIEAMLASSIHQRLTAATVRELASKARTRLRLDKGGYRREHVRAFAQRVEVTDDAIYLKENKKPVEDADRHQGRENGGNLRSRFYTEMAEEAGVEPTGDAARPPPDLKSGRPTGDVSLPSPRYQAATTGVKQMPGRRSPVARPPGP